MPAAIPFLIGAALKYAEVQALVIILATGAASLAVGAYQASEARRKARDAYNASLEDRFINTDTADGPRSRVYGVARLCDGILFKASSGNLSQFYTVFYAVAGHEINSFINVMFDDTVLTFESSTGYVLTAPYNKGATSTGYLNIGSQNAGPFSYTIPNPAPGSVNSITQASVMLNDGTSEGNASYEVASTINGYVVSGNLPAPGSVSVQYQYSKTRSYAKVSAFYGTASQNVGTFLKARFPTLIKDTDRFAGIAGLLVEFEYDPDIYPGLPSVTAVIQGAKILDTRTGVTAFSRNPAMIARDWALYPYGGGLSTGDLDEQSFKTAANACEIITPYTLQLTNGTTVDKTSFRFLCDAVCSTDGNPDPLATLQEIVDSMGGKLAWPAGQLRVRAGVYQAPVTPILDETWLSGAGQLSIAPEPPMDEAINIVRPTIANAEPRDPLTGAIDTKSQFVSAPIKEVRAENFITLDGRPLPHDVTYTTVAYEWQANHIAAITLRESRNGLIAVIPCNMKAFQMEMFDVIRVTLARPGWVEKTMEVIGWQFDIGGGVVLTLKETTASIYAPDAIFPIADATLNTNRPSPLLVDPIQNMSFQSGTAQLLRQADGTMVSRILCTWSLHPDPAVRTTDGYIEIMYGYLGLPYEAMTSIKVRGDATSAYISDVQDNANYVIFNRCYNGLVRGKDSPYAIHKVIGKKQVPGDVQGMYATVIPTGLQFLWVRNTEADYLETEVRIGAPGQTWEFNVGSYLIASGSTATLIAPVPGTYRAYAKHRDTSRNISLGTATYDFTVTAAQALAWQNVVGRPQAFRVTAAGFLAAQQGLIYGSNGWGLFNSETGALAPGVGPVQRQWVVTWINRATGAIVLSEGFDFYANPGSGYGGPERMNQVLNGAQSDMIVVVMSWDEPSYLRSSILQAMCKCGASRAIFGSPDFRYRAAYVLIGLGNCGEGNGFESYQGSIDNDPAAVVDVSFQIQFNTLLVTGMGATPRTLKDYSYVGDLNATSGATFGVNVYGQASTDNLAANAATEIFVGVDTGELYRPAGSA